MQEVKRPKKPLIYFYVAMILAIFVFNCLVAPYGQFGENAKDMPWERIDLKL